MPSLNDEHAEHDDQQHGDLEQHAHAGIRGGKVKFSLACAQVRDDHPKRRQHDDLLVQPVAPVPSTVRRGPAPATRPARRSSRSIPAGSAGLATASRPNSLARGSSMYVIDPPNTRFQSFTNENYREIANNYDVSAAKVKLRHYQTAGHDETSVTSSERCTTPAAGCGRVWSSSTGAEGSGPEGKRPEAA